MSTTFITITLLVLFLSHIASSKDYSDCRWFGNTTNAPTYPIDVCSAHSHETELDGLTLYSTRMECNDNGELSQHEWNNTECSGRPYHTRIYRKEDGYYFNCDVETSCPFTTIILWELSDIPYSNDSTDHNNHICAYDTQKYHEISFVTNMCVDLIEEYNMSFYIDCTAQQVTYQQYTDINCKKKLPGNFSRLTISEGCDDPFDMNSYVQIAECDDANYNPKTTMPTTQKLTTMPSQRPSINPTTSTTKIPSRIHSTLRPTITTVTSVTPTASGDTKTDSSSSNGSLPWIIIVVSLCVIIIVLVLLVFYIISRQKKLKTEVLLTETVNRV